MSNGTPLVWVDCEMTGLDFENDALVEIACVVTDSELNPLDDGITVVIKPPAQALENMNSFVTNMHTESGLINELDDGITLEEAQDQLLTYVKQHVPEKFSAPLAGSSVYVDRRFINRDLPELDAYLHYRLIDVSSIKELARRWYPKAHTLSPPKHGGHRAMADTLESIAELRYYREAVFIDEPGRDETYLKNASERHEIQPEDAGDTRPSEPSNDSANQN